MKVKKVIHRYIDFVKKDSDEAEKSIPAKKSMIKGSYFLFAMLILAVIFTADPLENTKFDLSLLTLNGFLHFMLVGFFVIVSPYGIVKLARIFKSEPGYKNLASVTLFMGLSTFAACVIWFAFFFGGFLLEYRGIFEKIIALWVLIWIVLINLRSVKNYNLGKKDKESLKFSNEV